MRYAAPPTSMAGSGAQRSPNPEERMTRTMLKSVLAVLVLGAAALAYAAEFGTAAEAKAML